MDLINEFIKETECVYKDEYYSVRDNGAVFRHARKGKRIRKHDNKWTFGSPNNYGYLLISSEVVHRIVAYAFIGEPSTPQHVVDHIDTNRQNNRPENLRWLTKLQNILKNPITVNKIIFLCGSIDAFLKDPSILKKFVKENRNFEWMRTVTPQEAQISWQRLSKWANWKNTKTTSNGKALGEWIFKDTPNDNSIQKTSKYTTSLTKNAIQKNWKTPSDFPICPQGVLDNFIRSYAVNLKIGEIFSCNKYLKYIIEDFASSKDEDTLWILCKSNDENAIKAWSLAQVTYENDIFVHSNLGSFFKRIGAEKQFTLVQGLEWNGENSIDDLIG